MSNPNTMTNPNQSPDFSKMSKDELENWAKIAAQNGKWDLVKNYTEAMDKLNSKSATLDTVDFSKMNATERKTFVKKQITEIKNAPNNTIKAAKEMELENLLTQLNDEKATNTKILTDMPGLKEYVSLSRRRNAKILNTISKLEWDANYPKNVLIYAMGITSSKYFSAGQAFKRWMARLTRNWKAENIKANIENLIQKCQIQNWESEWKKAIKKTIYAAVVKAKDTYLRKLQIQNSF